MVVLWNGDIVDWVGIGCYCGGIAPVCDGDIVDRVNGADQPDNT